MGHQGAAGIEPIFATDYRRRITRPDGTWSRTVASAEDESTISRSTANLPRAKRHIVALTLIEPDRAIHHVRHAAILSRTGRTDEAHDAATKARDLDADAPVDQFLEPTR